MGLPGENERLPPSPGSAGAAGPGEREPGRAARRSDIAAPGDSSPHCPPMRGRAGCFSGSRDASAAALPPFATPLPAPTSRFCLFCPPCPPSPSPPPPPPRRQGEELLHAVGVQARAPRVGGLRVQGAPYASSLVCHFRAFLGIMPERSAMPDAKQEYKLRVKKLADQKAAEAAAH